MCEIDVVLNLDWKVTILSRLVILISSDGTYLRISSVTALDNIIRGLDVKEIKWVIIPITSLSTLYRRSYFPPEFKHSMFQPKAEHLSMIFGTRKLPCHLLKHGN